jgi:hypothetical protein
MNALVSYTHGERPRIKREYLHRSTLIRINIRADERSLLMYHRKSRARLVNPFDVSRAASASRFGDKNCAVLSRYPEKLFLSLSLSLSLSTSPFPLSIFFFRMPLLPNAALFRGAADNADVVTVRPFARGGRGERPSRWLGMARKMINWMSSETSPFRDVGFCLPAGTKGTVICAVSP